MISTEIENHDDVYIYAKVMHMPGYIREKKKVPHKIVKILNILFSNLESIQIIKQANEKVTLFFFYSCM